MREKTRKVIEAAINDPDLTQEQIAKIAGTGRTNVTRILRRESVQEIMREMMEKTVGLRRADMLRKLREGLDATQVERFADKGRVKSTFTDVDYPTRGRYLDLACRISGATSQRVELSGPNGQSLIPDS